ncbi:hypothetical protein [Thiomicrorhabdus sp. Milos-T2]|uniref:hypothetical protein n=1 Tax=Thiomicrorhabdus sp. Milos-T2 TaxID=90814 RepID=UPI000493DE88|nr:hypothetical protein [Thiomicrorhabdus sp. Milos-T2]
MSFKEKLIWLKGKKIAVCETDDIQFSQMEQFLQRYDVEVTGLRDAEQMLLDLESRRYSTHRVYFAVFVCPKLAEALEQPWQEIVAVNPSIKETPLILTLTNDEIARAQPLIDAKHFHSQLTHPIMAKDFLALLQSLIHWNAMRGDITPAATLAK